MLKPEAQKISRAIVSRMKVLEITGARKLTEFLGLEPRQYARVYNWIKGKNGPDKQGRDALIDKLGVPSSVFDGIKFSNRKYKPAGRPKGAKNDLGLAQRALALSAQRALANEQANGGQALAIVPPVSDVFSCRVRSDGTIQVKLDSVLPYLQGIALMKFLMEFGLVQDRSPDGG